MLYRCLGYAKTNVNSVDQKIFKQLLTAKTFKDSICHTSDKNFCGCFADEAMKGCTARFIPPPACTMHNIILADEGMTIPVACYIGCVGEANYTQCLQDCETQTNYYIAHCSY